MKPISFHLLFFVLIFLSCSNDTKQFSQLSSWKTNIDFENTLAETMELNIFTYDYIYNGGGVALGDINNDGLVDIYFTGNTVANKLYLNKGNFEFEDITEPAGVGGHAGWKTGVTFVDINGDGLLDIYVCYSGLQSNNRANQLFINNGGDQPTFTDQAKTYGVDAANTYSTQASFFDYDVDGDLDLFLVNHGVDYHSSFSNAIQNNSRRHPEFGNQLFKNENGKFIDVSEAAGIYGGWLNYGLSASISDFNNDNLPDIYVSNDFDERDFLYINNGNGTFRESLKESFGHISKFTMGTDAADFNNDNLPDLLTLDMLPEDNCRQKLLKGPDPFEKYNFFVARGFHHQQMRNMLQLNTGVNQDGNPTFSEIGQLAGISMTDWSWAPLFADFDNDGKKDLFITNGYFRDFTNLDFQKFEFENARQQLEREGKDLNSQQGKEFIFNLVSKMEPIKVSNYMFQNTGAYQFTNQTDAWGLASLTLTNGAAYADLDNDGDLDLVTNNLNDKAGIFRNNAEQLSKNHFLKIKLIGEKLNTSGIGAKIYVRSDSGNQFFEMQPTRGYLSAVEPVLHIGLGEGKPFEVKVVWPSGRVSIIANPEVNTTLEILEAGAIINDIPTPEKKPVILTKYSIDSLGITFKHKENPYIDFRNERLLLTQMSTQGPAIATGDVNQDGREDFFIGGAIAQSGQLFLQTTDGQFIESKNKLWIADKDSEDVAALFFDADKDMDLDLVVISGGNEYPTPSTTYNDRFYINDGKGNFTKLVDVFPSRNGGGSCIAAADIDGDNDIDLFIGGWVSPGSHPQHTESKLLLNESANGKIVFTDVSERIKVKEKDLGIVHDAIWTDYNQDNKIDLIIVAEWRPIRIFKNTGSEFYEVTAEAGMSLTSGFWNRVEVADFDNDGDQDIVVGNLGLNSELKASPKEPLQLNWGDFDEDGKIDPIVSQYYNGTQYPVATRDELLSQVAPLKKKFPNYLSYAKATLADVLSKENITQNKDQIVELRSMYFENQGNGTYKGVPLPLEAQFAPVYAITIGDFNNDQHMDIIIGGNFKSYRAEYGPFDASKGLLLLGDRKGNFNPVNHINSGMILNGDVRSMLILKGKMGTKILLVGRNNDTVQTFKIQ